jgi:hypothetical protein
MTDPLLELIERPKAVPVAGMDGVFVRETSFADVMAYADRLAEGNNDRVKLLDANVRLLIASVCDENGALRYTEADIEKLSKLPRRAMNLLTRTISEVNGLNTKAVEDEAKNS